MSDDGHVCPTCGVPHGAGDSLLAADIANQELEAERDRLRDAYNELIYEVATKHPDESRHETAKRYIHEREHRQSNVAQQALKD